MRGRVRVVVAVVGAIASGAAGQGIDESTLVVRLRPGVAAAPGGLGDEALGRALEALGATVEPAFPWGLGDEALAAAIGLDRYRLVRAAPGESVAPAMGALAARDGTIELVEAVPRATLADTFPDDLFFPFQWGVHNTGQTIPNSGPGLADADIDAPEAWDLWTGSDAITIAVIDCGVWPHEDLGGKVLPGYNSVDDSDDVSDDCNHGTHVAGIAAAIGDNGAYVAGVNWAAPILPVKVFTADFGSAVTIGKGIAWAADHGADIGSMSLQTYLYSQFLKDSVDYAYGRGVLLIAASGNGAGNQVAYPALFPHCMGVGATTNTDEIASFSNYGPAVDVSAPGQDVMSLVGTNSWAYYSGTSMATPHVSGLASLVWSYRPDLTADEVEQVLRDTADDLGAPGYDVYFGRGRVNARAALEAVGCPADFNGDGSLDVLDFVAFQEAFTAGDERADANGDGALNVLDFVAFQDLFVGGCA